MGQSGVCRPNVIGKPGTYRQIEVSGPNVIEKPITLRQSGGCEPNVIEKPITIRQSEVCEPNVIEKPITLHQIEVSGPNVIEKPITLRQSEVCEANVIEKPITMRQSEVCEANVIEKPITLRKTEHLSPCRHPILLLSRSIWEHLSEHLRTCLLSPALLRSARLTLSEPGCSALGEPDLSRIIVNVTPDVTISATLRRMNSKHQERDEDF